MLRAIVLKTIFSNSKAAFASFNLYTSAGTPGRGCWLVQFTLNPIITRSDDPFGNIM